MTEEKKNEIMEVVGAVEVETQNELKTAFVPFWDKAKQIEEAAKAVVVTSPEQKDLMKKAREMRLTLKNIRVEVEKVRKSMKEESLRKGKAIDGMANIIKYVVVPLEEHLQKQENYIKIQEQKRAAELLDQRRAEIEALEGNPDAYNLPEINDETYNAIVETLKRQKAEREEQARKAEEERIAKEKAEREERERIKKENERLKKEAEEREAAAKKEREERAKKEAAEKAAREKKEAEERKKREAEEAARKAKEEAERKEREKREAELKAKAEAERKEKEKLEAEKRAKEEEERKAAEEAAAARERAERAPDKEKLLKLAADIKALDLPKVESVPAVQLLKSVQSDLAIIADRVEKIVKEQF